MKALEKYGDIIGVVRFEDLVSDPDNVQKFFERIGVEFNGKPFSDFHNNPKFRNRKGLNGLRPVDPENIGKWSLPENRDRIIEQFTAAPQMHDILRIYGYE